LMRQKYIKAAMPSTLWLHRTPRSMTPTSIGGLHTRRSPSPDDPPPYHLPDGSPQPLPWEAKITPPPKIVRPKLSLVEIEELRRKDQAKKEAKERAEAERARAAEEREAKRLAAAAEKAARQAEAAKRKAAADAISAEID
jgi:hypothetical protein